MSRCCGGCLASRSSKELFVSVPFLGMSTLSFAVFECGTSMSS